jgi:uncharacterized protein (DUF433 family)
MATPLSLRFKEDTLQRLFFQAKLAGMPPRTLAQRMLEEGLRMAEHPEIRFTTGPAGRRATLRGCGLDVWEVIKLLPLNGNDPVELAAYLDIPESWVQACIAYYGAYQDEIDERLELERLEEERGLAAYQAGIERLTG